eukprot:tig00000475_g1231.t1
MALDDVRTSFPAAFLSDYVPPLHPVFAALAAGAAQNAANAVQQSPYYTPPRSMRLSRGALRSLQNPDPRLAEGHPEAEVARSVFRNKILPKRINPYGRAVVTSPFVQRMFTSFCSESYHAAVFLGQAARAVARRRDFKTCSWTLVGSFDQLVVESWLEDTARAIGIEPETGGGRTRIVMETMKDFIQISGSVQTAVPQQNTMIVPLGLISEAYDASMEAGRLFFPIGGAISVNLLDVSFGSQAYILEKATLQSPAAIPAQWHYAEFTKLFIPDPACEPQALLSHSDELFLTGDERSPARTGAPPGTIDLFVGRGHIGWDLVAEFAPLRRRLSGARTAVLLYWRRGGTAAMRR